MARLPFLQFYPNDWLAEPALRACSLAARGLWIDVLSLMHLSPRRGYLLAANGSRHSPEQLARLTGCSADDVNQLLEELATSGVFSCTDDGTIYSRRMVRDEGKRLKCSEAGRVGGLRSAKMRTLEGQPKGDPKGQPKGESKGDPKLPEARDQEEKETPSGSVAVRDAPPDPDPPPKQPRPARKPSGAHAEFIAVFCDAWAAKYGRKYAFNGAKDGTAFTWFREQCQDSPEEFRLIVGRFLADREEWLVNCTHSVGALRSQFNRWSVDPRAKPTPARRGPVSVEERAERTLRAIVEARQHEREQPGPIPRIAECSPEAAPEVRPRALTATGF
jgi:hypothetical protein